MKRKKPNVYSVELALGKQRSREDVGRELGISSRLISRWVQEYKREGMEAFPQKEHQTVSAVIPLARFFKKSRSIVNSPTF